jgi:hypothetical protein
MMTCLTFPRDPLRVDVAVDSPLVEDDSVEVVKQILDSALQGL